MEDLIKLVASGGSGALAATVLLIVIYWLMQRHKDEDDPTPAHERTPKCGFNGVQQKTLEGIEDVEKEQLGVMYETKHLLEGVLSELSDQKKETKNLVDAIHALNTMMQVEAAKRNK